MKIRPYLEPEYRRRIRQKRKEDQRKAESERDKSKVEAQISEITAAIHRVEQEFERTNDEHTPQKNRDRLWEHFGIGGLWVAAAVGLIAIAVSSHDAGEQRTVMEGQLSEMKNQRLLTIAQLRANMAWQNPQITPIGETNNIVVAGEKLAGWMISPGWRNAGSTDAKDFFSYFDLRSFDRGPDKTTIGGDDCPSPAKPNVPQYVTVQPGNIRTQLAQTLSVEDAVKAQAGQKYILMVGHLEYRDVFPDTTLHSEDWCVAILANDIPRSVFSFPTLRDVSQ